MAADMQERVEPAVDDTDGTEAKTDRLSVRDNKAKPKRESLDSQLRALNLQLHAVLVELVKIRVGQTWILGVLGGIAVALILIFCALVMIALQL